MIQDTAVAQAVLQSLKSCEDLAHRAMEALRGDKTDGFQSTGQELEDALMRITEQGYALQQEEPLLNLGKAGKSALYSLLRIRAYDDVAKSLHKLEYELIPLLQEAYMGFYFWGTVYPDREKMDHFYTHELKELGANRYLEEAEKTGNYKYELSVIVVGYNKLEYTQMCVESLLKHMPEKLDYELILCNNGSSDQTQQYFEYIKPHKQIDVRENGGGGPFLAASLRVVEGRYCMWASNDVIITKNAVENMLKCMESDESISRIVPTTPNVSNLQTIPYQYNSIAEMFEFAEANNVYDPYRHEHRVRLCDPLSMLRSARCLGSNGIHVTQAYFYATGTAIFPDDVFSLLGRRNGYKNILAKDAFCHHFGSVTIKDEIQKQEEARVYRQGRDEFEAAFGVDPWGTGFCYTPEFLALLTCMSDAHIDVLGVNCGLGSNPLKIQDIYKEHKKNLDVTIYNVTDDKKYEVDLRGVSDHVFIANGPNGAFHQGLKRYHHIVWEDDFHAGVSPEKFMEACLFHLHEGGSLLFRLAKMDKEKLVRQYPHIKIGKEWGSVIK